MTLCMELCALRAVFAAETLVLRAACAAVVLSRGPSQQRRVHGFSWYSGPGDLPQQT